MRVVLDIPHRRAHGLCPVNGIRDLIHWRTGQDWSNEFVFGLGQGGGFAYLRFNFADPPRQVYWGTASPRQHKYLAELFGTEFYEQENRSFKYAWKKAQQAVDSQIPPILGPLDMFYLPFYPGIYQQRHIPIHFLLLVGYDDQYAYVHDTDIGAVQKLPLADLEASLDVNVPGMGKRNRLAMMSIPDHIPAVETLIKKSIRDECTLMLKPPVSMLGIPAMEKVSREISGWPDELGTDIAARCFRQVREYLSSPPDIMGDHLTAGRDIYTKFLQEAGIMVGLDFSKAISRFNGAMAVLPQIADAIQRGDLHSVSTGFARVAELEESAYTMLLELVGR